MCSAGLGEAKKIVDLINSNAPGATLLLHTHACMYINNLSCPCPAPSIVSLINCKSENFFKEKKKEVESKKKMEELLREGRSLKETPTWSVAAVTTVMVFLCFFAQRSIYKFGKVSHYIYSLLLFFLFFYQLGTLFLFVYYVYVF